MELLVPKINLSITRNRNLSLTAFLRVCKNSTRIAFSANAINLMNMSAGSKWMIGKNNQNGNWYLFETDEGLIVKKQKKGGVQTADLTLSNAEMCQILRGAFGIDGINHLRLYISNPIKDKDGLFFKLTLKDPYL